MAKLNIGSLFGDKDLDNMLNRVDTLVDTLSKQRQSGIGPEKDISHTALKEVLNVIEDKTNTNTSEGNVQSLLDKLSIAPERLNRYNIYDEIYRAVQIIKRIIGVYLNSCLQRDILTGEAISIKERNKDSDSSKLNSKLYREFSKTCIDHYKLETKISDNILQSVLRYGDHFIEIVDLKEDIIGLPSGSSTNNSNSIITENLSLIEARLDGYSKNSNNINSIYKDAINKISNILFEFDEHVPDLPNIVEQQYIYEKSIPKNIDSSANKFDKNKLNRVLLRFHKPHSICILNVEDIILGYVEIREKQSSDKTLGVGARFASMMNQLNYLKNRENTSNEPIVKELVQKIVLNIVDKLNIKKNDDPAKSRFDINKQYEEMVHKSLGDDVFYMVKKLLNEVKFEDSFKKLSVRFISEDRMIRITHNPIEYAPYGTSVLDALVYPGKLYLLNQLTNTVSKLSRAALIRKWTIETGPREYHSNQIQKLKRELKNQRVTVDDIMSFKSVPKVLSDFKDVIIVSKKGQKFVDFELQSMHDSNIKIADLEDQRRELIALSGVPAPYLGYNDVVELREQLVHVNVTFATEVIAIQTGLNDGLTKLIDRIADILGFSEKPSTYNTLSLKVPVVLLLQMIETIMSSVTNIQQNFQASQIDFDPVYLLKLYVPSLDWDDFLKAGREFKLLKKSTPPDLQDGQGGF